MRCRRFIDRRQAHEPGDGQTVAFAAGRNKGVGLFRQHSRLLRLATGIDLDEQRGRAALLGDLLGQRLGEACPIDGVDGVEERDRLLGLVGLQCTDEMELDPSMALFERRPLRLRLLHAVLAEYPLARGDDRLDRFRAERLRNGNERHPGRISPRFGTSACDLIADLRQRRFDEMRGAAHDAILARGAPFSAHELTSTHAPSWKMMPSVWRRPERRRLTPWRMLTR